MDSTGVPGSVSWKYWRSELVCFVAVGGQVWRDYDGAQFFFGFLWRASDLNIEQLLLSTFTNPAGLLRCGGQDA